MAKKKKRKPDKQQRRPPRSLKRLERLREADDLMRRHRWLEADKLLQTLDRQHPRNPDVLALRLAVAIQLGDLQTHQAVCERLIRLRPNDAELLLILAGSYLSGARPALAFRTFRQLLERWPNHPEAAKVRETLANLEPDFRRHLGDIGLGGEKEMQLAELHEEVQLHLERGDYAEARRLAEQLLQARPRFAPALNNSAEAYGREGHYEQASAAARRVLDFDPGNVHALANLTRYLFLAGRVEEAQETAARLKALTPSSADGWLKVAEALSYLGDDAGVQAATAAALGERPRPEGQTAAFLEHLAAVAAYRQGQEAKARQHWQAAVRHQASFAEAQENLADLRKPIGERHAAWPYDGPYWIPQALIVQLAARFGAGDKAQRETRRFFAEHPEIERLVPTLLDRGGPSGRTLALQMALLADTPPLQQALRDFALGQRGPDEQRMQAAQAALQAGLIPAGKVRVWAQGEWRDVLLMNFEISDEPEHGHSDEVADLIGDGIEALAAGAALEGERLLKQALEKEPGAPDIRNNLAAAYSVQGRNKEAEALIRQVHAEHPDYWFGIVGVARYETRAGHLDEATALLTPLLQRRKLHTTEFAALAMAEVELLLARGEREGAKSWVDLLARISPEHPALPQLRRDVRGSALGRLLGW